VTTLPELPSPSVAQLRAWLVSAVAAALEVEEAAVDTRRTFHEYGVTSAQAVSLSGELEEWLGRELSPALLYEHPTIDSLATALATSPADRGPDQPAPTPQPVPVAGPADRRADVRDPGIAVVGMACRFPGDADDPQRFWLNLLSGHHAARKVPADRWSLEGFHDPDPAAGGRSYTDRAGFVSDLAGFDAGFFGISPGEARRMDPQHRLLLEVVWAALEDAGVAPDTIRGSRTGVFVGLMGSQEWGTLQTEREGDSCLDDPFFGYGLAPSVAAGRVSYVLDARGPSMCVDTACSSSLLAVHLAARSLRAGECDLAVVAGVSALVHPAAMVQACRAHMLAADGRCKTFDAAADGFLIGEGCGVVVLQRSTDATRDRRRLHALLRGSAVTQDGRSNGMTAPSRSAQVAVIKAAHADGGVDATRVG
jgi:phthiocerol/phenolphthiocerol synthesis type-I polyketide synthase E